MGTWYWCGPVGQNGKDIWMFGDGNKNLLPKSADAKLMPGAYFDDVLELDVVHVARPGYRTDAVGICVMSETRAANS